VSNRFHMKWSRHAIWANKDLNGLNAQYFVLEKYL
jgi:hypothetical protein